MEDLNKPMLCDEQDSKKADVPIKKLIVVSSLCLFFMVVEIIGGYLANSLAILSDAAHLLSDISGFVISIFALYISKRPSSQIMSFGYHRAETIGALISISIVWGLVIWLIYEALMRIINPEVLDPILMMITAAIGLLVNITMALTLHSGHGHHHHGHSHNHEGEHGHDHGHGHDHSHNHGHNHSHNHGHNHSHSHKHKESNCNEKSLTKENIESPGQSFSYINNSVPVDSTEDGQLAHHKNFSEGFSNAVHGVEYETRTARTSGEIGVVPEFNQRSRLTNKNESNRFVIEVNSVDFQSSSENDSHLSEICSHNDEENINVHAALVHIIGDLIQSLGVLLASIILYFFPEWVFIDPICTLVFSVIVLFTTVPVAKECILVLSESVPKHINQKKLENDLLNIKSVTGVHNLHVWTLKANKLSLACHLVSTDPNYALSEATSLCNAKYGITHTTIQVENNKECEGV